MFNPVIIDEAVCNGCNQCVDICPMDIFEASPNRGEPPTVKYPDECAFDGVCWERCPNNEAGAIRVVPPLPMRVSILRGE